MVVLFNKKTSKHTVLFRRPCWVTRLHLIKMIIKLKGSPELTSRINYYWKPRWIYQVPRKQMLRLQTENKVLKTQHTSRSITTNRASWVVECLCRQRNVAAVARSAFTNCFRISSSSANQARRALWAVLGSGYRDWLLGLLAWSATSLACQACLTCNNLFNNNGALAPAAAPVRDG